MTLRDARPPYPEEAGAKRVRKKKEDRDREKGKRRNMSVRETRAVIDDGRERQIIKSR